MSASLASSCISSNELDSTTNLNNKLTNKRINSGFTIFQRILFSLPLSGDALIIFMFLRDVAGEHGKCFMSNAKIAAGSGRSIRTVINAKKRLSMPMKELKGRSLISCTPQYESNGNRGSDLIKLVDIWDLNHEHVVSKVRAQKIDVEKQNRDANFAPPPTPPCANFAHKQEPFSCLKENIREELKQGAELPCLCSPPKRESQKPKKARLCELEDIQDLIDEGKISLQEAKQLCLSGNALQIRMAVEAMDQPLARGRRIFNRVAWLRAAIRDLYVPSTKSPRKFHDKRTPGQVDRETTAARSSAIGKICAQLPEVQKMAAQRDWIIGWMDGYLCAQGPNGEMWTISTDDPKNLIDEAIKMSKHIQQIPINPSIVAQIKRSQC